MKKNRGGFMEEGWQSPTPMSRHSDGIPPLGASEGPILVTLGCIQTIFGLIMVTFGLVTIMHDASLSGVGAGLWGGAMAVTNGVVGVLAGFKGCYKKADKISPLAVTVYLALSLVSVAVATLALVLTATGLVRDLQKPQFFYPSKRKDYALIRVDPSKTNWPPILANVGLLLITAVELLTTVVAAVRCYWRICGCCGRRSGELLKGDLMSPYDSPHVVASWSTNRSKEKLVWQWLGQQSAICKNKPSLPPPVPFSPSNVKVPRRPADTLLYSVCPDYTFLKFPPSRPPNDKYRLPYPKMSRIPMQHSFPKMDIWKYYAAKDAGTTLTVPRPSFKRVCKKKSESVMSDEDVDRTYTGMDREIAEEFISVTMEAKRN